MEELKAKEKRMEEYHKQNRIKKVSFSRILNLKNDFIGTEKRGKEERSSRKN